MIATLAIAARDANVLEGVMELNVGSKARPCTYETIRNIAFGTVDVHMNAHIQDPLRLSRNV